jgi:hypothetical protein
MTYADAKDNAQYTTYAGAKDSAQYTAYATAKGLCDIQRMQVQRTRKI